MARQTKATPENNYTIEVVWHKAKHFPKKSGYYLFYMNRGSFATAHFSAKWNLYNSYDEIEDDRPGPFHNNVVAWAKIPAHKFMVNRKVIKPLHPINSREEYLCVRDDGGNWSDFLWYNQVCDAFNSTDDDPQEKANRFEIKVDRWCRIAPPKDF